MQMSLDGGEAIDLLPLIAFSTIIKLAKTRQSGDIFIFHQQRCLLNLLLFYLLAGVLSNERVNIIYDIHDLHERKTLRSLKLKVSFWLFFSLEFLVFKIPIRYMTVSRGISLIYYKRFKKKVAVVRNIPSPSNPLSPVAQRVGERVLVYFGAINEKRLPLETVRFFVEKGYKIDIYGKYIAANDGFREDLESLVGKRGGKYCGSYTPGNLGGKLDGYSASLMIFDDSLLNIRYCLPNKLFQSIDMRLPCIVSPNLYESKLIFKNTGFVVDMMSFYECGLPDVDVKLLEDKMVQLFCRNKKNYVGVLGGV